MNYKTKNTLKQILAVALAGLAAFGAIFGLVKLSEVLKEETKVIHPSFEVGGINAEGKGDKDLNGSIYTKESFECQGLEVKLDFDAEVSYQIYYYNDLDELKAVSSEYTASMILAVPSSASHARIVVTPFWDDDVEEDDRVVQWYDVAKYANQLEIRVDKEQNFEPVNLFVHNTANEGKLCGVDDNNMLEIIDAASNEHAYATIDVTGLKSIKIVYVDCESANFNYDVFDANGNNLVHTLFESGKTEIIIELPEGATTFAFNYNYLTMDFEIYAC